MLSASLISAAHELRENLRKLEFRPPVAYVYQPLDYAAAPHEAYLRKYGNSRKKVIFIGMNPGPFGMTQTGVPFGEIEAVRDWLGITGEVGKPEHEHPKRPVTGFACKKSEVSGRRLWGLFRERFGEANAFFAEHFVSNYCPLVFMSESGANLTPDKLPAAEAAALYAMCNEHLKAVVTALKPQWLIGIGGFAEERAKSVAADFPKLKVGRVMHPSPANPAANHGWGEKVTAQMRALGIWE